MTLFEFDGVPVRLHFTFFIIAIAYIIMGTISFGLLGAATAATLISMLFGSVLLHEMGHAAMAKRFGIGTRAITLHILGGLASIEREPDTPREEIYIALAGPAVNLVLFAISLPLMYFQLPGASDMALINAIMGIFNLFPAYPMDGGRVFKALLQMRYGAAKAKKISLQVTVASSIILVAVGLYLGWIGLALVGGFLFIIARAIQKNSTTL
jgi:Zn-dependent protease